MARFAVRERLFEGGKKKKARESSEITRLGASSVLKFRKLHVRGARMRRAFHQR